MPPVSNVVVAISIFRHGDRTFLGPPDTKIDHDPIIQKFVDENGGYGQLTAEGRAQHALVGQAMKERYLESQEGPLRNFVHVRSSGYDRTLLSAEAQLAAMWGNDAPPIHSVLGEEEILLRGYTASVCPIMEAHSIRNLYGQEATEKSWVSDAIKVARVHNFQDKLKIPLEEQEQVEKEGVETIQNWLGRSSHLAGAPLISEIMRILTAVSQGEEWSNKRVFDQTISFEHREKDPRLVLYSAHDFTLVILLNILGQADKFPEMPPYATSMVFEMDDGNCITIWYNDDLQKMFTKKLHLTDDACMTPADLKKFVGSGVLFDSVDSWMNKCSLPLLELSMEQLIVIGCFVLVTLTLMYRYTNSANTCRMADYSSLPMTPNTPANCSIAISSPTAVGSATSHRNEEA